MKNNLIIIGQFIVIVIICILFFRSCQESKQKDIINFSSQDSLHKTINKLGQEISTRKLLVGTIAELKNVNAGKDIAILELKKIVDKKTLSATVIFDKTVNNGSSKTIIDTSKFQKLITDKGVFIFPIYETSWETEWSKGFIKAGKDSIFRSDTTFNQFSIQSRDTSDHFYTSNYPIVSVKNNNPNTRTINMASFTLDNDKKKQARLVLFLEGVAIGFLTYKLLIK